MKIVHICLGAFFPDNYSYQENMLPKFHKKAGYDVEVIASLDTFDEYGNPSFYPDAKQYINENDVLVTRLAYKKPKRVSILLRRFIGFSGALEKAAPDILFIHNCQFIDIRVIVSYLKKHKNVVVYVDNHADFSNSATNWLSKNILHGIIWCHCAKIIEPFTTKFYGVLPARVDFLKNIYKLPANKCELLVMGADDDLVEAASKPEVRQSIRKKYGISEDDFLVITGGKIDQWKTQTLLLMEAVKNINDPKLKLLVFGSVTKDLMPKVKSFTDGDRIQYIGWIDSRDSYQYFAASDLAVFPGRHSVFWEQVAAQGIPMICKKWDGTTHVDLGGNVVFLTEDSADEIKRSIEALVNNDDLYMNMKMVAMDKGKKTFSYRDISRRAIEE